MVLVILDVVVAWALYILLKPVNKSLAMLAAWFRLVYAAIFGIALHNFLSVLQLLSGADYLTVFETEQLQSQAMLFLNAFNYTWHIGLTVFALHLFVLGYLIFKSTSSLREISFLSKSSKALLLRRSELLVLNLTQANRANESENE
jgi:hypothetical protein